MTKAGQKLEQHQGQTSTRGGSFPKVTGDQATKNAMGQRELDDILTTPGTKDVPTGGKDLPGGRYYIAPDGRGAAFDRNGQFQYFGVFD